MTTPSTHPLGTTISQVVDHVLELIAAGRGGELSACYHLDAVLDATVPNWRFQVRGADAIGAQYAGWFADPARFEQLERVPTPTGEVVTYLLAWEERGVPHAAHHCHAFTVRDGLVERDRVFCGGRWPAALLAQMEAAQMEAAQT